MLSLVLSSLLFGIVSTDFYGGKFGGGLGGLGGGFGGGLGGFGGGFGGSKVFGGSQIDSSHYGDGNKLINDQHFQKISGLEEAGLSNGQAGYNKGEENFKDMKGDSGFFSDVDEGKKEHHDGGSWYGDKNFGKEGKAGAEKSLHQANKKGHSVKGFSTSHHKDEHGKTEEFYDEEHDEGGNEAFDGQSGSSGESGKSASKGGHEDGKFSAGDNKKGAFYEHELVDGKVQENHGHFGENKRVGEGEVLEDEKISGLGDVSGHHRSDKFYRHYPTIF